MTPDKETLDRLAKKRQYKLRGIISSFEWVNPVNKSIANLIVSKGSGSNKKFFAFTVFRPNALVLEQLKVGYRIKIWFSIRSTKHSDRWYTNLLIDSFEHWIVNEDKLKKEARIKELSEKQKQIDWGNPDFQ